MISSNDIDIDLYIWVSVVGLRQVENLGQRGDLSPTSVFHATFDLGSKCSRLSAR